MPNLDFLKIDIDSADCVLAEGLLRNAKLQPIIISIETNPQHPPPAHMMAVGGQQTFASVGCSLSAQVDLFAAYGYHLLVFTGFDSIFISEKFILNHLLAFRHEVEMRVLKEFLEGIDVGVQTVDRSLLIDEFECFRLAATDISFENAERIRYSLFELSGHDSVLRGKEWLSSLGAENVYISLGNH